MPRPALRSRSLRRKKVKRPGGETVIHYSRRKPSKSRCKCGTPLSGIPRKRPSSLRKIASSKRKPSRPFGGSLCPACTRESIKAKYFIKEEA